ncbi:MAG: hypothetical protein K0S27_681 [Gammaproteobacteria bacterium]|jgi:hypothetical protein|nr:hypothetical protein [Gammaproteobacteria bacterium]
MALRHPLSNQDPSVAQIKFALESAARKNMRCRNLIITLARQRRIDIHALNKRWIEELAPLSPLFEKIITFLKECKLNDEAKIIEEVNLNELSEENYAFILDFITSPPESKQKKTPLDQVIQDLEEKINDPIVGNLRDFYPFCPLFMPVIDALKEDQDTDREIKIHIAQYLTNIVTDIREQRILTFEQISASEQRLKNLLVEKKVSEKLRLALRIGFIIFSAVVGVVIAKAISPLLILAALLLGLLGYVALRYHLPNRYYKKLFKTQEGQTTKLGSSLHTFFHSPPSAAAAPSSALTPRLAPATG